MKNVGDYVWIIGDKETCYTTHCLSTLNLIESSVDLNDHLASIILANLCIFSYNLIYCIKLYLFSYWFILIF